MEYKKTRYFNRELSWLEFNQRVLDEACDSNVPLLERLKFLAITDSNLSEFFMVRVGGLSMLASQGILEQDPSGLTPSRQLEAIGFRARKMVEEQYVCFNSELSPGLEKVGIRNGSMSELSESQRNYLQNVLTNDIFPVVTPIAVREDADIPLPPMANLTLHLLVRLKPDQEKLKPRFALIPVHGNIKRIIPVPSDEGYLYVLVEELITAFIGLFFPGEEVTECIGFRITRNADINLEDEFTADLLAEMENVLTQRKQSDCIRLEVREGISGIALSFLKRSLKIRDHAVYQVPGPLQFADFMALSGVEGFEELKYDTQVPQPALDADPGKNIFQTLSGKKVLLYHPYESFDPVLNLISEAADDPDVLAIKQILYRVSRNSPVVAALGRAARNGKYVTAIVELRARFDEARNIEWARRLEREGVQVIYGEKGFKTHAKATIVVRREQGGIVRYLHFGTGNYNEQTARLYSDISYLTSDEDLAADASAFFNAVTGYSQLQKFKKLAAAPLGLRERIIELIYNEMERKEHGQKALIMAKMNSLVDREVIDALYRASRAGITVMLNIRGICCLRPGVPGLSENIEVTSIVGRFLEHSRIFYFLHGGEEKIFISSADWMTRNLNRRVELMIPIEDASGKKKLKRILETHFKDTAKARKLLPDGRYERVTPQGTARPMDSQKELYRNAREAFKRAQQKRRTVFEPHKPPDDTEN